MADTRATTTHHVVSPGLYVVIFALLLGFTGLTVWVATLDLGPWNTPVALAIAITKATLVVLFFMHLRWSSRLTWLAVGAALFWLLHMIGGTAADYLSRQRFLGMPGT
jgi:cytochrome c oxidase subunit IV